MSETKDLREEILREQGQYDYLNSSVSMKVVYDAMDEYADKRMEQLLEWMAKNNVKCDDGRYNEDKSISYKYNGEWHTKEELIQNFL